MRRSVKTVLPFLGALAVVLLLVVVGCGPAASPTATPTKTPQPTAAAATATPTKVPPTPTPQPTAPPQPVFGQFRVNPDKLGITYPNAKPDFSLAPKRGGVFKTYNTVVWPHFDANQSAVASVLSPTEMVYSRLVACKGPLEMTRPNNVTCEPAPALAESWQVSADGKVWTFNLRKGVKWQNLPPVNGREFTSDDVKYTWERYQKGGTNSGVFSMMAKVETPDKYTVRLTLNQTYPDFLFSGVADRFNYILPHEIADRDGDFKATMVGTGPFQVKQINGKERIVYERNPNYFVPGAQFLDGVEFSVIVDDASGLAAFRGGQVHTRPSPVMPAEMRAILSNTPDALFYSAEPTIVYHFSVRMDKPPFNDVRVRRAVSMAIDRPGIIKDLWEGSGFIATPIPWQFIFDSKPGLDQLPYYKYDPAAAKALLADAGYPNGFSFTLNYYGYSETTGALTALVTDNLKAIGVKLELKPTDYTSWVTATQKGTFEQAAGFPVTKPWNSLDGWLYGNMHSGQPGNQGAINDPALDKLLEAQRVEIDPAKRMEIVKQIFGMEVNQVYRIPLPKQMFLSYVSKKVHNYVYHEMMPPANYFSRQLDYMWLDQ